MAMISVSGGEISVTVSSSVQYARTLLIVIDPQPIPVEYVSLATHRNTKMEYFFGCGVEL